jgi:hypothetical protein
MWQTPLLFQWLERIHVIVRSCAGSEFIVLVLPLWYFILLCTMHNSL